MISKILAMLPVFSSVILAQAGGLVVFGDSISCGVGGGNLHNVCSPEGFGGQLGKEFPGKYVNYSRGGDMAADMARTFVYPNANPGLGGNPTYIVYIGNNDHAHYGTVLNEDHRKLFEETDLASVAWLAITSNFKIMGDSAAIKKTGTWIPDGTIPHVAALESTTGGSTLSFPIQTGTGLYIGWRIINGNSGEASVEIDGHAAGKLLGGAPGGIDFQTFNKTTDTIAVNRFRVRRGKHTVKLTVTSATDPKNVFSFVWAGSYVPSTDYSAPPPPRVLVGGVIRLINNAFPYASETVDKWVHEVVDEVHADGLNVVFVPVRDYVNATSDMLDAQHPNAIGHQHLYEAFEKVMKGP